MTLNEHRYWLAQFQGWIAMGLVAFPLVIYGLGVLLRLCVRPLAREFLAAAVYIAVIPVCWFSATLPCVMIRMPMPLSVVSDR